MQVNFNFCQPATTILNANSINRSVSQNGIAPGQPGQPNQDRVAISAQGRVMSAVENLMKQKESIREQRTELVTKTAEGGGNLESIKEQLEFYDEQLTELDKQIKQLSAESMKQAVEKDDDKKTKKSSQSKTEEQLESEQLTSIAGAMDDVRNAEKVASVKSKVEGEARVERSEIHIEQLDVARLESKLGTHPKANVAPLIKTAKQSIASKMVDLAALEDKALSIDPSQHLKDANEKVENGQAAADQEPEQGADSSTSGQAANSTPGQAAGHEAP